MLTWLLIAHAIAAGAVAIALQATVVFLLWKTSIAEETPGKARLAMPANLQRLLSGELYPRLASWWMRSFIWAIIAVLLLIAFGQEKGV
ncbi:MAG: hypothetical protein AAGM84_03555 [Pseudomonadota bacterium]